MKYINDLYVDQLLSNNWHEIVESIEEAFLDPSSDMIPKTYMQARKGVVWGDFRAMPAALGDYIGLKWIGVMPNNRSSNLPTTIGTFLLNDRFTGEPLIAMDCTALTAYRTAATSALVAKYCAPNNVTSIAFIGCGKQAYYHALAYQEIFGNFTARLYDKDMDAAIKLSTELHKHGLTSVEFNKDFKKLTGHADIITTLTPSATPYLDINDIKSNCHINAIGADAKGKRELMTNIIDGSANVICDDPEQAFHSGELQYNEWPYLDVSSIKDLIENHKTMQLNKGVSVFDSTGVAIEDIAIGVLTWDLYNNKTKTDEH
tara:strand:+ start:528 stop:1478 length:951 start_codon:yes stop_codon:yes gene_type:complete